MPPHERTGFAERAQNIVQGVRNGIGAGKFGIAAGGAAGLAGLAGLGALGVATGGAGWLGAGALALAGGAVSKYYQADDSPRHQQLYDRAVYLQVEGRRIEQNAQRQINAAGANIDPDVRRQLEQEVESGKNLSAQGDYLIAQSGSMRQQEMGRLTYEKEQITAQGDVAKAKKELRMNSWNPVWRWLYRGPPTAEEKQKKAMHKQALATEKAKARAEKERAKLEKQKIKDAKAEAKARQKQNKLILKQQTQQIKAQNGGGIISRTLAAPFRYMGGIVGALGGGALTATADTVRNSLRLGPGILGDVLRLGVRNPYLAIAGSIRGAVGNVLRIPAVFLPGLRGYASDMRRNATSNFSGMLDNFKTPRVVMDQAKSMAYAALGAGSGYIGAHGELLRPLSPSMANALQYCRNGIVNSLASPTPVKPSAASEKEGSRLSSAQTWLLNQSQTPAPSSQATALTMHPAAGAAPQAPPVPTVPHELTMTPGGGRANGTSSGADQLGMQPARGTQRPDQQAA